MIVRNVVGHLSMELFPSGAARHPILAWLTTTTHHALHHKDSRSNFGLYFTFWDRTMGTTHAKYDETFDRAATR
jgi:lathosterol oxidase